MPSDKSPQPAVKSTAVGWSSEDKFNQDQKILSLETEVKKASNEASQTKKSIYRDLSLLESKLEKLQAKFDESEGSNEPLPPRLPVLKEGESASPTPDLMEECDAEFLAYVWIGQVKEYRETAMRLQEEAVKLFKKVENPRNPKLLEGLNTDGEFSGSTREWNINTPIPPPDPREPAQKTPTHKPDSGSAVSQQISAPKSSNERVSKTISSVNTNDNSDAASPPCSSATATTKTCWVPHAVTRMPTPPYVNPDNTTTFTWEFIRFTFGGEQFSPGYYFDKNSGLLKSKGYWLLDADFEPLLPPKPGQHGAKITGLFNNTPPVDGNAPEEENFLNTPVFVRAKGAGNAYVYFGNYSQLRFSDKVDYDRMMDGTIPFKVAQYWAEELASPNRPEWVTRQLMEHFWPKPPYIGPLGCGQDDNEDNSVTATPFSSAVSRNKDRESSGSGLPRATRRALKAYVSELSEWERDARMKVNHLNYENILQAFTKADADEEPGLRLWLEYLECVGYDEEMYNFLVVTKNNPKLQQPAPKMYAPVNSAKGSSLWGDTL